MVSQTYFCHTCALGWTKSYGNKQMCGHPLMRKIMDPDDCHDDNHHCTTKYEGDCDGVRSINHCQCDTNPERGNCNLLVKQNGWLVPILWIGSITQHVKVLGGLGNCGRIMHCTIHPFNGTSIFTIIMCLAKVWRATITLMNRERMLT